MAAAAAAVHVPAHRIVRAAAQAADRGAVPPVRNLRMRRQPRLRELPRTAAVARRPQPGIPRGGGGGAIAAAAGPEAEPRRSHKIGDAIDPRV